MSLKGDSGAGSGRGKDGFARGLDRLLALADGLSRVGVLAGGGLMLAAAFLVSFDVVLRRVAVVSLGGSDELSGYAFAIGTSWALAFTLLRRANVRVDSVYLHLPRRLQGLIDLVALAALGLFVLLLCRQAIDVVGTSWRFASLSTTPLKTPLWIPQGLWVVGLVWFLATMTLLLVRTAWAWACGDDGVVARLAGVISIEEEAADETASAAARATSNKGASHPA